MSDVPALGTMFGGLCIAAVFVAFVGCALGDLTWPVDLWSQVFD
jgi:hypothetical protein